MRLDIKRLNVRMKGVSRGNARSITTGLGEQLLSTFSRQRKHHAKKGVSHIKQIDVRVERSANDSAIRRSIAEGIAQAIVTRKD